MSAPADTDREDTTEKATGIYVYGIVPGDTEENSDVKGVGDPAAPVELVRHGEIAAMVSEIRTDQPLGRPDDLMAHESLLDAAAGVAPVLPIRFGAVLADRQAVEDELLAQHHDQFLAALKELEGRAEYVVKARYEEAAVMSEVLSENQEASRLRDEIRAQSDQPEELTQNLRMRLGEIIGNTINAKREQDTQALVEAVTPVCVATSVRQPSNDLDAAHVALLVETERQDELEEKLDELAANWDGRATVRLLGPLAAYDFVVTPGPTR